MALDANNSFDDGGNVNVNFNGCYQPINGPFQHTLFLGCSVMSFSCSIGWNEQEGGLTVQLVKDTCDTDKQYWDENLDVQTWTSSDPGFIGLDVDIIGCPVYFRLMDFEYSGIVQSWEEQKSESANPTYTVKIVDPRQIIQGAQLIVGEYGGGIG